ncbi:uncharacterized protein [Mytilus edulis]|uniref:uncharacterized protein n=1 Tax=Mytilus edulis TaxID=6550 RepID=UPI0039F0AAC5
MNNQNYLQSLSCKLYHYLSENVVGSENVVRYRRYFYKCFDESLNYGETKLISSGSKPEGLDLAGSDLDLMLLLDIIVDEQIENLKEKQLFFLDTENASPGFALIKEGNECDLRYTKGLDYSHAIIGHGFFLTNECMKEAPYQQCSRLMSFLKRNRSGLKFPEMFSIQGPSVSMSLFGCMEMDYVPCCLSRSWPTVAKKWLHRHRSHEWPSAELITMAIYEGVLLVPVGSKSDSKEENRLEWRLSFSLAEKLLVHSFNHCQLLCYALLKIFLREIINNENIFNKELCSYYMKTILFWILEEVDHSYWTKENLLRCFRLCIQRLHYFVWSFYIPNYFIPEHNMIEGRFSEHVQKQLEVYISKLLKGDIWKVLLSSMSLSDLRHNMCCISKPLHVISELEKTLMTTNIPYMAQFRFTAKKSLNFFIYRIQNEYFPTALKNIYTLALIELCKYKAISIKIRSVNSLHNSNKHYYSQYKQCLFHLLLNLNSDAVSGWLLLGTFFFSCQEYRKMTEVINLSEELLSRELYDLPFFDYTPTLKRIDSKALTNCRSFLKNLRHTFIKSYAFDKISDEEDSFIFDKDLILSFAALVCCGSPAVYLRYLTFLKLYKQNQIEKMMSSFLLLKEAFEKTIPQSHVLYGANCMNLINAQLLIGDEDYRTTARKYVLNLQSFGVTGM